MLSNAASKGQHIDSFQRGNHSTNTSSQAVNVKFQGKLRPAIVLLDRLQNLTHIDRNARDSFEARFVIEDVLYFVGRQALLSLQIDQYPRINGPGTTTHHYSL